MPVLDFEGQGYKTTLRAPDAGQTKRYVFNMSDLDPAEPGYTSVAPIFLERGREFVGTIRGNTIMPKAKIALNITQLVLDLGEDGEDFVITLDNDTTNLDYSVCNPANPVEDPWGGCAISVQGMENVTGPTLGKWSVYLNESVEAEWKDYFFKLQGPVSGNCINDSYSSGCYALSGATPVSVKLTTGTVGAVEDGGGATHSCDSGQTIWIYDNLECE